jgi:diadenosine tetraphosphate (Ap4A) HIT family hydrolase
MSAKADDLIWVDGARSDQQRKVMEQIRDVAECPFCEENLKKYHKKKILKKGKYWLLTENQWPYKHTKLHLLAIARKHVERLEDLPKAAFGELLELFQQAEKEHQLDYGAVAMRFGDVTRTGATVLHLHAHLIVADHDHPDYTNVRFKVG